MVVPLPRLFSFVAISHKQKHSRKNGGVITFPSLQRGSAIGSWIQCICAEDCVGGGGVGGAPSTEKREQTGGFKRLKRLPWRSPNWAREQYGPSVCVSWSRIHERTISLRFLGKSWLEVSAWITRTIGKGVWFSFRFFPFSFTVYSNCTVEIHKKLHDFEEIHKRLHAFLNRNLTAKL
jgi:hypothetical protein